MSSSPLRFRLTMSASALRRSAQLEPRGTLSEMKATAPVGMGSQKLTSRQASTPSVATLRVRPKVTRSTGVTESITPSPAGVIGMAPSTLAIPYAAKSPTGLVKLPNAAMKHHSDAASSSQFSDAQLSEPTRTRRSRARRRSDSSACRTMFSSRAPPT